MAILTTRGLGWVRDLPDPRDLSIEFDSAKRLGNATGEAPWLKMTRRAAEKWGKDSPLGIASSKGAKYPATCDFRKFCSPIENQGELGSCTAQAVVGAMEYLQILCHKEYINGSRLFLYKVTRNLLGWEGDSGAYTRTTIKALRLFGACPEDYWPYSDDETQFDQEPSSFCFAFAANYKALKYYSIPGGTGLKDTLLLTLSKGIPVVFGFTVLDTIEHTTGNGDIPAPDKRSAPVGGHAVMAVGYDRNRATVDAQGNEAKEKGSLLIRNSWGEEWGDKGYGWLPFSYMDHGLCADFWALELVEFEPLSGAIPGGPDRQPVPRDKAKPPRIAQGLRPLSPARTTQREYVSSGTPDVLMRPVFRRGGGRPVFGGG